MMASSRSAAMRVTMLMKKRMVMTERQRLQEGQRRWQKYQICRRKQAADEWTMMEDNKSMIAAMKLQQEKAGDDPVESVKIPKATCMADREVATTKGARGPWPGEREGPRRSIEAKPQQLYTDGERREQRGSLRVCIRTIAVGCVYHRQAVGEATTSTKGMGQDPIKFSLYWKEVENEVTVLRLTREQQSVARAPALMLPLALKEASWLMSNPNNSSCSSNNLGFSSCRLKERNHYRCQVGVSSTHRLLGREWARSGKEEDPSLRVGEKGQR
ncbi:hypothetical protein BHE74_00042537 [Ensete ventricosum]|nr:hypothetical protein BHE74_00042537 [Ensete ventricosum]